MNCTTSINGDRRRSAASYILFMTLIYYCRDKFFFYVKRFYISTYLKIAFNIDNIEYLNKILLKIIILTQRI